MMISISIPEAKGIIRDYISKHYRLLEPEEDLDKIISFVEDDISLVEDKEAARFTFNVDVVLAGPETK